MYRCCKIADLIVELPSAGGLASRCGSYFCDADIQPDISIREADYDKNAYGSFLSKEMLAYMQSGFRFAGNLVSFAGFVLHASAVVVNGKSYLFSGQSGAGKSTHTKLWQQVFGSEAKVINDDKPALRCIDGIWYAYGTPWCGKDGININMRAPVAGVCFLKQAQENSIRRLEPTEALQKILAQTLHKFYRAERLDLLLGHLDHFLRTIPVYELENRPEPEAALLSYKTMRAGAEEAGL